MVLVVMMLALLQVAAGDPPVIPVPAGRGVLESILAGPLPPHATLALQPGIHEVVAPLSLNTSHSGLTITGGPVGSAVISAGSSIDRTAWHPTGTAGMWAAMLPATAMPAEGASMPRQLWMASASASPQTASRRTRARHPNLYDDATGTILQQFPYMYWATPLEACPGLAKQCERGSKCSAVGCNHTMVRHSRTGSSQCQSPDSPRHHARHIHALCSTFSVAFVRLRASLGHPRLARLHTASCLGIASPNEKKIDLHH
jgi:hypothetical protein